MYKFVRPVLIWLCCCQRPPNDVCDLQYIIENELFILPGVSEINYLCLNHSTVSMKNVFENVRQSVIWILLSTVHIYPMQIGPELAELVDFYFKRRPCLKKKRQQRILLPNMHGYIDTNENCK